jgi:hypothetical protein
VLQIDDRLWEHGHRESPLLPPRSDSANDDWEFWELKEDASEDAGGRLSKPEQSNSSS